MLQTDVMFENESLKILYEGTKSDARLQTEIDFLIKKWKNNWITENPLNDYLHSAASTNKRGNKSNRFDERFKSFCSYLYMKGGASCYESIYLNSVLPVEKSCKRVILETHKMEIGKVYIDEFVEFMRLHDINCDEVIISEDATRISNRVEYDSDSNQLFGLQPELDMITGLTKQNFFKISTPSNFLSMLTEYRSAPYLQVVTAKPMTIGSPARIIAVFPTDNRYTTQIVISRWNEFKKLFKKHDINIRMSSDADPRLLGAMKKMSSFGKTYNIRGLCMPLLCDIDSDVKSLSDPFHLLNNFKNRMYDLTGKLKVGKFYVSMNFLKIMVNNPNVSKNDHLLSNQDIGTFDTTKDKMNTTSTRKICEPQVIELLKVVPGSEGTVAYLQIMRAIYDAFIDPEKNDMERLYSGFWALSMIRRWRNNIEVGSREMFITNVNWACLELNVAYLYEMVKKGKGKFIIIWNSQYCEETFRTLRAMTPSGLTQINFTLMEALERLCRVQKMHEIATELKDIFTFPENIKMKSDISKNSVIRTEPPSLASCHATILKAHKDARALCKALGMNNLEECNPENFFKFSSSVDGEIEDPSTEEINEFIDDAYGEQPIEIETTKRVLLYPACTHTRSSTCDPSVTQAMPSYTHRHFRR